ncbi:2030_t:CDS:2 [Racocetra persica]|uniref:2030_t:CDS:1 n=1 Tax=Racocetra persica TaxID=160502 RepID=A0ACA9KSW4_9GLOM|nr:2030_t:CDS:2 [Racocetra persica]
MGQVWTPLTLDELKIWLEIVIYIDIIKLPRVTDYWTINPKFPKYYIIQEMFVIRFQQIKQYLHISNPNSENSYWYSKVKPLASHIKNISKQLYVPRSQISVNKMMIYFSDQSSHTFRIKNKPIPEEYKVMSLCKKGERQKLKNKQSSKVKLYENSAPIINKNFKLSSTWFSGINHYPEWQENHAACAWY